MKIGINGYEAVVPRFGYDKDTGLPNRVGSGEFCFQLLTSISKIDTKNNYFIYLPVSPTQDMPEEKENWKYEVFSASRLWTLVGLGKKLFRNEEGLDIFFSPTHYTPLNLKLPSAILILDISYLHFPGLFNKKDLLKLKYWGKYSIRRARRIITISESSKNDIIKEYGVSPQKVEVVYPGIKDQKSFKTYNMNELEERFGIDGKYILFVGTLQPRKNIARLIEAFSKVAGEYKLVIAGRKGWQYEEILKSPKKFDIESKVIFVEDANDEELPSLYKNAEIFVLPSLYEGFGLPVLEAMKYDCPVITSDISSLPEAGGDAALYVNPEDVNDISEKMQKLLNNEALRKELIKKGQEQVKKFSWDKSARETIKVLESI